VWRSVFLLFALGLRSLNDLEQVLRRTGSGLLGLRPPSADTIAYALSRVDPAETREVLHQVNRDALRKKAVQPDIPRHGLVAAIDGHEFFSSRRRCCDECSTREITTREGVVTEYYHRGVVCQLVGVTPPIVLDFEMQKKGEGEVTAARRLLTRLLAVYGRLLFAITLDGAYVDGILIKMIRVCGIEVVVALKNEQLHAYQELLTLSEAEPPVVVAGAGMEIRIWDFPDIQLGELEERGRVVRAIRTRKTPARRPGRVNLHADRIEETRDWRYLVFGAIAARRVDEIGHLRWEVENRAFHELSTHGRLNHCFVHQFEAMQNILVVLFLAFALTRLFFERNVKAPVIRRATHLAQRGLLRESIGQPGSTIPPPPG
jgi:hypothetical protein